MTGRSRGRVRVVHCSDPLPEGRVSIRREEHDVACCRLAEADAPLRHDRDQAWRDFVAWRGNYDAVLRRFASLCWAPDAPWSSDRAIRFHRALISRRRARIYGDLP